MDFKHLIERPFYKRMELLKKTASSCAVTLIVLLSLLITQNSQAQPLKSFPNHPQFSFDPADDGPEAPKCSEIRDRMEALKKIIDESITININTSLSC